MADSWRALLRADGRGLAGVDPGATPGWQGTKHEARAETDRLVDELDALQTRLHAAEDHALLVVLQGRDTSGKDGVVRKVLGRMSPLGFRVEAFGPPTGIEAAHDFLWRAHLRAPGRGQVVVFNRSHYEDVLVRRVQGLDPDDVWRPRFAHIRAFEALLTGDGATAVVKVALHISADEQRERLQARLDRPDKRWKFRRGDLDDRARWADYDEAYAEAIAETDRDAAPWYVVPADRKWYRDLAVAHLVHETLTELDPRLPEPDADLDGLVVE